jgi:hypothetical protein
MRTYLRRTLVHSMIRVYVCDRLYLCVCAQYARACTHTHTHTHTHTTFLCVCTGTVAPRKCMYVCVYAHTDVCVCLHTRLLTPIKSRTDNLYALKHNIHTHTLAYQAFLHLHPRPCRCRRSRESSGPCSW